MRERVDLKSPVRENRPPGSVRGAAGNRRPYRDITRDGPRLLHPLDSVDLIDEPATAGFAEV